MNDEELLQIIVMLWKHLSPQGSARAVLHFQAAPSVAAPFILEAFNETGNKPEPVHSSAIVRVQTGHNHFLVFALNSKKEIVTLKVKHPLCKEQCLLTHPDFMRVHRYHVIQFAHLIEIQKKGVLMEGNIAVPVAPGGLKNVKQGYHDYRVTHPV